MVPSTAEGTVRNNCAKEQSFRKFSPSIRRKGIRRGWVWEKIEEAGLAVVAAIVGKRGELEILGWSIRGDVNRRKMFSASSLNCKDKTWRVERAVAPDRKEVKDCVVNDSKI